MATQGQLDLIVAARDQASSVLSTIGGSLAHIASTAAGFAIGAGLTELPGFLSEAAKQASEDSTATDRLNNALRNVGGSFDEHVQQVNEAIKAGQGLAFSDDDVRDSFQTLLASTGNVNTALERQKAAYDLSRGAGIDLGTATKMLSKLTADHVEVFKKMGITLGKNATEADALAAVQKRFGGQADTYANSTAGQFAQAQIAISETKEAIGYALLPIVGKLGSLLVRVLPLIQDFAGGLADMVAPAIDTVMAVVEPFIAAIGDALPSAWEAAKAVIAAFTTDAGALGIVLADIRTIFGDTVANAIEPFVQAFMVAIPAVEQFVANVGLVLGQVVAIVQQALGGDLSGAFANLVTLVSGVASSIGTALLSWGQAFLDWVGPLIPPLLAKLGELATAAYTWITATALPGLVTAVSGWATAFLEWVTPIAVGLVARLGEISQAVYTWVTGTALPTIQAQLLQWGQAFVDWIGPMLPVLAAKLGEVATAVIGWVQAQLPGVQAQLATWATAAWQWAVDAVPPLLAKLGDLLTSLVNWASGVALPAITTQMAAWGLAVVTWIGQALPPALAALGDFLISFINGLAQGGSDMTTETGTSWVSAVVDWIATKAVPALIVALPAITEALMTFIDRLAIAMALAMLRVSEKFSGWIATDVLPALPGELAKIVGALSDWLSGTAIPWAAQHMASLGSAIVNAVAAGISNGAGAITQAALNAAHAALQAALAALGVGALGDIRLPSLPAIPQHGAGGVVGGPIGMPRLIIAHGGERVLTVGQQAGGAGGGGGGIHVTVNNPDADFNARRMARDLYDQWRTLELQDMRAGV